MHRIAAISSLIILVFLIGCDKSPGEKLYYEAFDQEQKSPYSSIASYKKVIAKAPKSTWAEKAQQRIDALLQRKASRDAAWAAEDAESASKAAEQAARDAESAAENATSAAEDAVNELHYRRRAAD